MRRHLPAILALSVAVGCGSSVSSVHFARPPLAGGRRAPTPDDPFRAKAPAVGKRIPFTPPAIEEARLSNGVRVLYLARHEFPIVSLRLVSSLGGDLAPLGVGPLWARMLFRGPDGDDRGKVWRAFGAHGADVQADVYDDLSAVGLQVLSGDYRRCIELLGEVVRDASFPATGLEDARVLQLSTIARRADNPHTVARIALDEALYPIGDRYREPVSGTTAAIKAVTRAQLVAYHREAMNAERLSIAVAGDFEPKTLLAELEQDFGKLPKIGAAAAPTSAPIPASTAPRLTLIDRPGSTQATIIVGALGVGIDHADRAAIEVLRARLGARVMSNLREEHAYTYGASSAALFTRRPGPIFVEGAIDIDHAGEAIKEVLAEIDALRKDPLPKEDLADAIDGATLRIARFFDSADHIAARLGVVGALGAPASFDADDVKMLSAITAADVTRVTNTYFAPDAVHIIVVGDSKVVKPQLDALDDVKVDVEKGSPEKGTPETSE